MSIGNVLASSAKEHEVEHYIDLLDARGLADAWTTSADVEQTKPDPIWWLRPSRGRAEERP